MDTLLQDLRFGLRTLVRSPGFTAGAVLTLALGIGANSAIFSLVHGVLLQPLEYREADRLVALFTTEEGGRQAQNPSSPANFLDWRRQSESLEAMTAAHPWSPTLTGRGNAEQISGLKATVDLFTLLGTPAALGTTFQAAQGEPEEAAVVVLGHEIWQRRFGGDAELIGQPLILDGVSHTVIGVMPPGFRFPPFWATEAEFWVPLAFTPDQAANRQSNFLRVFARVRSGATVASARAEMEGVAAQLAGLHPEVNAGLGVHLVPLQEPVVAPVRTSFGLLLAAAGLVLLLACANIASLLLARGLSRRREILVRAALGAGRLRIARQLLTESLLLALAGGALGAVLGVWGLELILHLGGAVIPRAEEIAFDGVTLAFTLAIALLTGLLFGLLPALRSTGGALDAARSRGGGSAPGLRRVQGALVVAQVTLAMVLLVGAGLVGRSLARLQQMDPGFRTENLLTLSLAFAGTPHAEEDRQGALFEAVLDAVRPLPGVREAGLINHLPIGGDIWSLLFHIEGVPVVEGEEPRASFRVVTPGALEALGISLQEGRAVEARDRQGAPPVVWVNEALARRHFPGGGAVGARLRLSGGDDEAEGEDAWITIAGVVSNTRQWRLTETIRPEILFPYGQNPVAWWGQTTLVLHTVGDPEALVGSVREAVWAVDGNLPMTQVRTASQLLAPAAVEPRLHAWVFGLFATLSLVLAAVGLYGTLSYQVRQRRREFGIRLAVGAGTPTLLRNVALQGLRLAAAGIVLGLAAALLLRRAVATLLFELSPTDPATLATVAAVLLGVVLVASWLPARQATRVDPMEVLREE
jgi:predicted permease